MEKYENEFSITMKGKDEFFDFIKNVKKTWVTDIPVSSVTYAPFAYVDEKEIAPSVIAEARKDAYTNKEMAVCINGWWYPIRYDGCAAKTLLERNKMTGRAMSDMSVTCRSECLNMAKKLYPKDIMKVLIQEDKASAFLSGGEKDYAILDAYELLAAIQNELDDRFEGADFVGGYFDHTRTAAEWKMPKSREKLIGSYIDLLKLIGKGKLADRLVPGIKFSTSDIGIGKATVSAYLYGGLYPICVGSAMELKHRSGVTVADFAEEIGGMFAMFNELTKELERLHTINLDYPVNVMTALCKKLLLPKKYSMEVIDVFKAIYGEKSATAGDVYLQMQEILFIAQSDTPEKQFTIEEHITKALNKKLDWKALDKPGEVKW